MESAIIILFGHVGLSTAIFVLQLTSIRGHYLLVTDFSCILSQCYWLFLIRQLFIRWNVPPESLTTFVCLLVVSIVYMWISFFQHTISVVHYFTLLQAWIATICMC